MNNNNIEQENNNQKTYKTNDECAKIPDYKYYAWIKSTKKSNFLKFNRISIHQLSEDSIIIISPQANKLAIYTYNLTNSRFQELVTFNTEEYFHTDSEFIHPYTLMINTRSIYLFKNSNPNDEEHVYIFDIHSKRIYPIKNDNSRPSTFRINYSISLSDVKIYFFGGLNMQLEPLSLLESYNITTYKWELISTKGKAPNPRHSHCAYIANSNLFIIGGTNSRDFFSKDNIHFDDVYILNLITLTWTPVKTFGDTPKYLAYINTKCIADKYILFTWCDKEKENYETRISKFDLDKFEWMDLIMIGKAPDFRFNAGFHFDEKTNMIYVLGGFYLSKSESLNNMNELDRMLLSENKQIFEKNDIFNYERDVVYNQSADSTTQNHDNIVKSTGLIDSDGGLYTFFWHQ